MLTAKKTVIYSILVTLGLGIALDSYSMGWFRKRSEEASWSVLKPTPGLVRLFADTITKLEQLIQGSNESRALEELENKLASIIKNLESIKIEDEVESKEKEQKQEAESKRSTYNHPMSLDEGHILLSPNTDKKIDTQYYQAIQNDLRQLVSKLYVFFLTIKIQQLKENQQIALLQDEQSDKEDASQSESSAPEDMKKQAERLERNFLLENHRNSSRQLEAKLNHLTELSDKLSRIINQFLPSERTELAVALTASQIIKLKNDLIGLQQEIVNTKKEFERDSVTAGLAGTMTDTINQLKTTLAEVVGYPELLDLQKTLNAVINQHEGKLHKALEEFRGQLNSLHDLIKEDKSKGELFTIIDTLQADLKEESLPKPNDELRKKIQQTKVKLDRIINTKGGMVASLSKTVDDLSRQLSSQMLNAGSAVMGYPALEKINNKLLKLLSIDQICLSELEPFTTYIFYTAQSFCSKDSEIYSTLSQLHTTIVSLPTDAEAQWKEQSSDQNAAFRFTLDPLLNISGAYKSAIREHQKKLQLIIDTRGDLMAVTSSATNSLKHTFDTNTDKMANIFETFTKENDNTIQNTLTKTLKKGAGYSICAFGACLGLYTYFVTSKTDFERNRAAALFGASLLSFPLVDILTEHFHPTFKKSSTEESVRNAHE